MLKRIISEASPALAAEAEAKLLNARACRYREPGPFLDAVREFTLAEYYRDAGFKSFGDYGQALVPQTRLSDWEGWEALSQVLELPDEVLALIRTGALQPRILGPLRGLLTQTNWRQWLTLAMNLKPAELAKAAKEYRRMRSQGFRGHAVFVPLWIPDQDYRRLGLDRELPAWSQIGEKVLG